jgi:hypothetical protein
MEENIRKLGMMLAFAFIIPIIGYLFGVMWSNSIAKLFGVPPNPTLRKLAVSFFLLFPVLSLAIFVKLDYDELGDWWHHSPYLVSALGLILFVLLPWLLIVGVIKVWRSDANPSRWWL